jgi:hypothetical protein
MKERKLFRKINAYVNKYAPNEYSNKYLFEFQYTYVDAVFILLLDLISEFNQRKSENRHVRFRQMIF